MKILAIPENDLPPTSERTPEIYRRLMKSHTLVQLGPRWDKLIYDVDRPAPLRLPLYLFDKLDLIIRGLRAAKTNRVDLIFCETYHHALVGVVIAKILGRPCVWDSHGNVLLFAESQGKSGPFRIAAGTLERFIGKRVDALITVTNVDADMYASQGIPRQKIHVFPSCVDVADVDRRVRERRLLRQSTPRSPTSIPVLFFFGSFKYEPNRDALRFVDEVLAPSLAKAGARFKIQVAGRDIPAQAFHPSIEILGFVPDIYAPIADADLGIVPLWKGVGILVKALDMMAVGTPIIGSSFVAKGIPELRNGEQILLAETPDEFIRLIIHSLEHPEDLQEMGDRGRSLVREHYDWNRRWPMFEHILTSVVESQSRETRRARRPNA